MINKKYVVNKRSFYRLFLIICAFLNFSQKKRKQTSYNKMIRVHDLQETAIKKIVSYHKKNYIMGFCNKSWLLAKSGSSSSHKNYICIFPGASSFIKMWPKENILELINLLLQKTDYLIYVMGAQNEVYIAQYVCYPPHDRVINLVNQCSLG